MALPTNETEFKNLIDAFESCRLPISDWRHQEHVAVAVWYLIKLDEDGAVQAIRQGIQNLNAYHGVPQTPTSGYHETWTIFLTKILGKFLRSLNPTQSTVEQTKKAVEYLRDFKSITLEYYSRDRIMSWEARTNWQEPDLKPL